MSVAGYEKITKTQLMARVKRLQEGEVLEVNMLPCKASLNSVWISPTVIHVDKTLLEKEQGYSVSKLEGLINSYAYYNCNNELGTYPVYYVPSTR